MAMLSASQQFIYAACLCRDMVYLWRDSPRSADIRSDKKRSERQVNGAEYQVVWIRALFGNQNDYRNRVRKLFQNGRNHEQTKTDGIPGDENKSDLPDQSDANETIEESRMRDRRRIFFADQIEHKITRSDHQEAVDRSDPDNDLGNV